jgi:hypothetical protein
VYALLQIDTAAQRRTCGVDLQFPFRMDEQRIVARDRRPDSWRTRTNPRGGGAVVEARLDGHIHRHSASGAGDLPDQLVARVVRPAVAHRECVGDHDRPTVGHHRGLEHHRVVEIAARRAHDRRHRTDAVVSAVVVVQQPGKGAAGVEAPQAGPVDRAMAAHQGGRVTVTDECVVTDRQVAVDRRAGRRRLLISGHQEHARFMQTGCPTRCRSNHAPSMEDRVEIVDSTEDIADREEVHGNEIR